MESYVLSLEVSKGLMIDIQNYFSYNFKCYVKFEWNDSSDRVDSII